MKLRAGLVEASSPSMWRLLLFVNQSENHKNIWWCKELVLESWDMESDFVMNNDFHSDSRGPVRQWPDSWYHFNVTLQHVPLKCSVISSCFEIPLIRKNGLAWQNQQSFPDIISDFHILQFFSVQSCYKAESSIILSFTSFTSRRGLSRTKRRIEKKRSEKTRWWD